MEAEDWIGLDAFFLIISQFLDQLRYRIKVCGVQEVNHQKDKCIY
jgi:hypothetical protein